MNHAGLIEYEDPTRAIAGMRHEQGPLRRRRRAVLHHRRPALPLDAGKRGHGPHGHRAVVAHRERLAGSRELTNLDRAECHLVAMILQTDMPALGTAEVGELRELALRNSLGPVGAAFLEREVSDTVDAHLPGVRGDTQGEPVPLARRPGGIRLRLVQLVEPTGPLGICLLGMKARRVAENLHLGPAHPRLRLRLGHVEHHTAVSTGCDPELELQFEAIECLLRDEVPRVRPPAHEGPFLDHPARARAILPIAAKAIKGLAVEQDPPAGTPLGLGERVRRGRRSARGGRSEEQHDHGRKSTAHWRLGGDQCHGSIAPSA